VTFASALHVEQNGTKFCFVDLTFTKKQMLRTPNFQRIVAGLGND
jgi:hypothetical protein